MANNKPMNKSSVVPKKFYLLFILLIVFLCSVICIITFIYQHINRINNTFKQLNVIKENIEIINTSHHKILVNQLSSYTIDQETYDQNKQIISNSCKINEIFKPWK